MRVARVVGTVAVLAAAAYYLRDNVPSVSAVAAALRGADDRWLAAAAVLMFLSMVAFARQQRRLLTAFGVTLPRHRALALAYSRSAMSISLPAGSAVSAAYAFRQFRRDGADRRAAMLVMVLSGVLSLAGLIVLFTTGALTVVVFGVTTAWQAHPALTFSAAAILAVTITALTRFASRSIAPRHWLLALGSATVNWSTDLLCLVAAARAFDVPLGIVEIAALHLTVQVVRQIPLTPGGIGVIEASLLAGFAAGGVPEAAAAATVLAYRVLSCWLIIPVGALGWLVLRRTPRARVSGVGHPAVVEGSTPPARSVESAA